MSDASDAEITRNQAAQEEIIYHKDSPMEIVFNGLHAQSIVRDQPVNEVNEIIEKLKNIWLERQSKQITHEQLEEKLNSYKSECLDVGNPADIETIQVIEQSIVKIKYESKKYD
jgi:allophanate hydrolase subunit 1